MPKNNYILAYKPLNSRAHKGPRVECSQNPGESIKSMIAREILEHMEQSDTTKKVQVMHVYQDTYFMDIGSRTLYIELKSDPRNLEHTNTLVWSLIGTAGKYQVWTRPVSENKIIYNVSWENNPLGSTDSGYYHLETILKFKNLTTFDFVPLDQEQAQ